MPINIPLDQIKWEDQASPGIHPGEVTWDDQDTDETMTVSGAGGGAGVSPAPGTHGDTSPEPSFVRDVVGGTLRDVAGVVTKAGAGIVKGATLGAVDPEAGTIGIPFTNIKTKYAPPLGQTLQETVGTSEEIAENPYIGLGPEMIGTGGPWTAATKALSRGVNTLRGALNATRDLGAVGSRYGATLGQKAAGIAERAGIQAGAGALVGAAEVRDEDESMIGNVVTGAALGAGMQLAGEAIHGIAQASGLTKSSAYQKLHKDLSDLFFKHNKVNLSQAEAENLADQAINAAAARAGLNKDAGWWEFVKKFRAARNDVKAAKREADILDNPEWGDVPPEPPASAGSLEPVGPKPPSPPAGAVAPFDWQTVPRETFSTRRQPVFNKVRPGPGTVETIIPDEIEWEVPAPSVPQPPAAVAGQGEALPGRGFPPKPAGGGLPPTIPGQPKTLGKRAQRKAKRIGKKGRAPDGEAESLSQWIKELGGIWDDSLPGEIRQFGTKEARTVGLVRKKTGKSLDELAKQASGEGGWLPEGAGSTDLIELLKQEITALRTKKPELRPKRWGDTSAWDKRFETEEGEFWGDEGEEADRLAAEGWDVLAKGAQVPAGDLEMPGTKIIRRGEEFTSHGFDDQGNIILKDGETLHVDPFEMVEADAVKAGAPMGVAEPRPMFGGRIPFGVNVIDPNAPRPKAKPTSEQVSMFPDPGKEPKPEPPKPEVRVEQQGLFGKEAVEAGPARLPEAGERPVRHRPPRYGKQPQGELDFRKVVVVPNQWSEAYHLQFDDGFSLGMDEPTFFDTPEDAVKWAKERGIEAKYIGHSSLEKLEKSKGPWITSHAQEGSGGVTRVVYRNENGAVVGSARYMGTTIGDIAVPEKFRRKGYGKAILEDMKGRGGKSGIAGSEAGEGLMKSGGMVSTGGGRYEFRGETEDPKWALPGSGLVVDGEMVWENKFSKGRYGTVQGHFADTPKGAIAEDAKMEAQAKEGREQKKRYDTALEMVRSGNYDAVNWGDLTRFGKPETAAGETEGILRHLGLNSTQARKIIKGSVGYLRMTRNGASIFDIKAVVEYARGKGLIQGTPAQFKEPPEQYAQDLEALKAEADRYGADYKGAIMFGDRKFADTFTDRLTHGDFSVMPGGDLKKTIIDSRRRFVEAGQLGREFLNLKEAQEAYSAMGPVWYSQMEEALAKKLPGSGDPVDLLKTIDGWAKKGEIKQAEFIWSGLQDYLFDRSASGAKKISKTEILDFIRSNQVEVHEKMLGEPELKIVAHPKNPSKYALQKQNGEYVLGGPGTNRSEEVRAWDTYNMARQYGIPAHDKTAPKFSQWVLPGGENYRELLLALPVKDPRGLRIQKTDNGFEVIGSDGKTRAIYQTIERAQVGMREFSPDTFTSSHFPDTPNIFAHVRMNDRMDADGNRVLFIEELQSDWSIEGRKKGWTGEKQYFYNVNYNGRKIANQFFSKEEAEHWAKTSDWKNIAERSGGRLEVVVGEENKSANFGKATPFPFMKNWEEVAMKRMLRYAAENGYDRISWVNGEETAKRYDLSKHVDSITYERQNDGNNYRIVLQKDGKDIADKTIPTKELPEIIGKEVSEKIINGEGQRMGDTPYFTLHGLDLKTGGKWAYNLYDKMVPSFLGKFAKKWGAKVEPAEFELYAMGLEGQGREWEWVVERTNDGRFMVRNRDGEVEEVFDEVAPAIRLAKELSSNKGMGTTFQSLPITPTMKAEVLTKGLALFEMRAKYAPAKPENLAIVHNLTADNLKHAHKMGGLAVPSMAVVNIDKSRFGNFGGITLIATPGRLGPKSGKEAKYFNADVYSPRYPRVSYFPTEKTKKSLDEWLGRIWEEVPRKTSGSSFPPPYVLLERMNDNGIPASLKGDEPLVQYAYLKETGNLPPGIDTGYESRATLREAVEKLGRVNFEKWVDRKIADLGLEATERIFAGFTPGGNRKYLKHDLDTVVKMLRKDLRDGEGFNYGAPSIRAKVAQQFWTVKAMKEARDKIVTAEEMKSIKDEVDDEFGRLANIAQSYVKFRGSDFGFLDIFTEHIKEAIQFRNFNRVFGEGSEYYNPGVDVRAIEDFVYKLRDLPTEYFEGKIQRSVRLDEFSAAVVPDAEVDEVSEILGKAGISIHPYKWNDAEDRARAVKEASQGSMALFEGKAQYGNIDWDRIKELGTTTDLQEAGFIAPDGSLIDLSGKNDGGTPGRRLLDHGEVGGRSGMRELTASGYIRMDFSSGYLDMNKAPTLDQIGVIRKFIDDRWGEVYIETAEGLGPMDRDGYYTRPPRVFTRDYPRYSKTKRILNDIKSFYAGEDPAKAYRDIQEKLMERGAQLSLFGGSQATPDAAPPAGPPTAGAQLSLFGTNHESLNFTTQAIAQTKAVEKLPMQGMVKTLGVGISAELINKGAVNWIGKKITGYHDLGPIAMTVRNPQYETSRFIFVRMLPNGLQEIVGHEAVSSRCPSQSLLWPVKAGENRFLAQQAGLTELRNSLQRLGATGFYSLHNHPSGTVDQSTEDTNLTGFLKDKYPEFLGAMIINHNKFLFLAPLSGTQRSLPQLTPIAYEWDQHLPDDLLTAAIPHNLLGHKIAGGPGKDPAQLLARLGLMLRRDKGNSTLLYFTPRLELRAIQDAFNDFIRQGNFADYARDQAREFGSSTLFVVTEDLSLKGRLVELYDAGIVGDGVLVGSNQVEFARLSSSATHNPFADNKWMGMEVEGFKVAEQRRQYDTEGVSHPAYAGPKRRPTVGIGTTEPKPNKGPAVGAKSTPEDPDVLFDELKIDLPEGTIKHRRLGKQGEGRYAPPVTKDEFAVIKALAKRQAMPGLVRNWIETGARMWNYYGKDAKELFYRRAQNARHAAHLETLKVFKDIDAQFKKLPAGSSKRVGIFAISEQPRGMELLKEAGVDKVPDLTPQEQAVYSWARTLLSITYGRIQDARKLAGQKPFREVQNYFTFMRNFSFWDRWGMRPANADLADLKDVPIHLRSTPFRFAKRRIGGTFPAEVDARFILKTYMRSALQHIHVGPEIAKMRELLGRYDLGQGKEFIFRDINPSAYQQINDWVSYVSGVEPPTNVPVQVQKVIKALSKNIVASTLAFSVRSTLIQPTALLNTWSRLGTLPMLKVLPSFFSPTDWRRALEQSKHLSPRTMDLSIERALEELWGPISRVNRKLDVIGYYGLRALDYASAHYTWLAAERAGRDAGLKGQALIEFADDVTIETQGSGAREDISKIQRYVLGHMITLFQTFNINQWGYIMRDMLRIGATETLPKKEIFRRLLYFLVGATVINTIYEDGLGMPSPLPTPFNTFLRAREEGRSVSEALAQVGTNLAGIFPIGTGGLRFGSSPFGAVIDLGIDWTKKAAQAGGGMKGQYVKPGPELVGRTLGARGTSQIYKTARGLDKGLSLPEALVGTTKSSMPGKAPIKRKGDPGPITQFLGIRSAKKKKPSRGKFINY